MLKVGRKPALPVETALSVEQDYRTYLRLMARAKRLCPAALSRKYGVSPSTVLDYGLGRHKGHANHGLSRGEIRGALDKENQALLGITGDLFGPELPELSVGAPIAIVPAGRPMPRSVSEPVSLGA